jgi:hypothetical protein
MRTFCLSALILTLAIISPSGAADPVKMHARAEAAELMLLRQKAVQEDLKIDKEDVKKIYEFTYTQHHAAMEVHKLPEAEQDAKWAVMIKENQEFIHKTLKPEQLKRLKQIAMQTSGLLFLTRPAIAKEMNLTEEQKRQVKEMVTEMHTKVAAVVHAPKSEGRNEKLAALRKASDEHLEKLFTADQKSKWKELIGEPFTGKLVFEEASKQ